MTASGMILYDLKHPIKYEDVTFILLHFANKDNNVDVLYCNTVISDAKNKVLTTHHSQDPVTNKLQKNTKERRIVREARSEEVLI